MDAFGRKTCGIRVRSSRVVLSPRRWGQVCEIAISASRPKREISRRRRLTSPTLRGEHGAAVKPLRRECRSDFGVPVLACVRLFLFCTQGSGCGVHPAFPAPSVFRGSDGLMHHPDAKSRRGNDGSSSLRATRYARWASYAGYSPASALARSPSEAIQIISACSLIASRFASRNDGVLFEM